MQIESDTLTKTARENWSGDKKPAFQPSLVMNIYKNELHGSKLDPPKLRRIMLLEISQYLENYLIPSCSEVPNFALSQASQRRFSSLNGN